MWSILWYFLTFTTLLIQPIQNPPVIVVFADIPLFLDPIEIVLPNNTLVLNVTFNARHVYLYVSRSIKVIVNILS